MKLELSDKEAEAVLIAYAEKLVGGINWRVQGYIGDVILVQEEPANVPINVQAAK